MKNTHRTSQPASQGDTLKPKMTTGDPVEAGDSVLSSVILLLFVFSVLAMSSDCHSLKFSQQLRADCQGEDAGKKRAWKDDNYTYGCLEENIGGRLSAESSSF